MESVLEKYLAALKSYLRTGVILIVEKMQKRIGFLGEVSSFLSISLPSEVFAAIKVSVSRRSLPQRGGRDHHRNRCVLPTLVMNLL